MKLNIILLIIAIIVLPITALSENRKSKLWADHYEKEAIALQEKINQKGSDPILKIKLHGIKSKISIYKKRFN